MRIPPLLIIVVIASSIQCGFAVVTDDRLPADSVELKHNDPPATSAPWRLPKPGDPLYDAKKEAQIKKENAAKSNETTHHLVRVFERGVFKGYQTIEFGDPAQKMGSVFTPNPSLSPDIIELSSVAHPDKSDYFPSRPQKRPWNVPDDYIAVKVIHRGNLIGWTFMSKEAVALLHKPKKT